MAWRDWDLSDEWGVTWCVVATLVFCASWIALPGHKDVVDRICDPVWSFFESSLSIALCYSGNDLRAFSHAAQMSETAWPLDVQTGFGWFRWYIHAISRRITSWEIPQREYNAPTMAFLCTGSPFLLLVYLWLRHFCIMASSTCNTWRLLGIYFLSVSVWQNDLCSFFIITLLITKEAPL